MTAPKFTPGPWIVRQGRETHFPKHYELGIDSPTAKEVVASVLGQRYIGDGDSGYHETISERDANARLIASAPELYKALERIAGYEYRSDRRHRGMVDTDELETLKRIARSALSQAVAP